MMTIYKVTENINQGETRLFSTKEKAKDFILKQYEKYYNDNLDDAKRECWYLPHLARESFDFIDGVEDFAYIEEIELDDNADFDL